MKKSILRLSIFAALFLLITSLITAASVTKCPYCEDDAPAIICPVCSYEIKEHSHVATTGTDENGKTIFINMVLFKCPDCGSEWLEEVI